MATLQLSSRASAGNFLTSDDVSKHTTSCPFRGSKWRTSSSCPCTSIQETTDKKALRRDEIVKMNRWLKRESRSDVLYCCDFNCGFQGPYTTVQDHEIACALLHQDEDTKKAQQYGCDFECGFFGSFDVVLEHEKTCGSRNPHVFSCSSSPDVPSSSASRRTSLFVTTKALIPTSPCNKHPSPPVFSRRASETEAGGRFLS